MRPLLLLVGLSLITPSVGLYAHGDVHGQITNLTAEIQRDPRNAELYVRRGELQRIHQDWDAAQADYDQAKAVNPQYKVADFLAGRMYLDANWLLSAKTALDRFLKTETNHAEAFVTRGRVLVKLNQRLQATADYTRAIALEKDPSPEHFLERAQAFAAEGTNYYRDAIKGLEEGIKRIGPLVTFQLAAIEIEVKQARLDAALKRLDEIMARSPRKETWLARRAEILRQAGRTEEARNAYKSALVALGTLPPTRRYVPAMVELEKRINTALADLKD